MRMSKTLYVFIVAIINRPQAMYCGYRRYSSALRISMRMYSIRNIYSVYYIWIPPKVKKDDARNFDYITR